MFTNMYTWVGLTDSNIKHFQGLLVGTDVCCVHTKAKHFKSDRERNAIHYEKCSHPAVQCANHDQNIFINLSMIENKSRGSLMKYVNANVVSLLNNAIPCVYRRA